jgi:hypothetical protein
VGVLRFGNDVRREIDRQPTPSTRADLLSREDEHPIGIDRSDVVKGRSARKQPDNSIDADRRKNSVPFIDTKRVLSNVQAGQLVPGIARR